MNIELKAVTKVNDLLLKCDHLEPAIDSLDRIPLTDGHIDVHSTPGSHANATFVGRVNVQVKGKIVQNLDNYKSNYSIETSALRGFSATGGILYFVVFMGNRGQKRKVHYAVLTPFRIQTLLAGIKTGQKMKTVPLKRLPAAPNEIEAIVNLALRAQNEIPGSMIDRAVLDKISEFTLYTDGSIPLDAPVVFDRNLTDFSISYKTSENMIGWLDGTFEFIPVSYMGMVSDVPVSSGEFSFPKPLSKRLSRELWELQVSDGLRITIPDDPAQATGTISLSMRPLLEDRYQDLGFFLSCMDTGKFHLGDRTAQNSFALPEDDQALRTHFETVRRLRELILHLHGDPSLVNLEMISDKQARQLSNIYDMMISGIEKRQPFTRTVRLKQSIGEWCFELLFVEGSENGNWKCLDLYSPDIKRQFIAWDAGHSPESSRYTRVTAYELMDSEELSSCLNLNLENIVEAYKHLSEYDDSKTQANLTVLNLIQAADLTSIRRDEFLRAAEALNSWLLEIEGDLPTHIINHAQIALRFRHLTEAEKTAVRRIKRMAAREEIIPAALNETACAVLLGDYEEISECLDRLNHEQLEVIRSWPIWHLYLEVVKASNVAE